MNLNCAVQFYDWGKKGESSEVAQLAYLNSGLEIRDDKCYAELWMGTHVNGPSIVSGSGEDLGKIISSQPECLGEPSRRLFKDSLPFLLKVLSVNKPLSIQAHPTKSHAETLHAKFPDIYKDGNHKPEMAIALTPFEALCGFRPLEEIRKFLETVPELQDLVGKETIQKFKDTPGSETLKQCFSNVMRTDSATIQNAITRLVRRLHLADERLRTEENAALIERLNRGFPGDVGVLGPYWFNYINLKPGEALYLSANEPHAYISGDCIECMACSDNVVRAGLTPKMKDVDTLVEMLTYGASSAKSKKFSPEWEDKRTTLFAPPVPDFCVAKMIVPAGEDYTLIPRDSASIFVVVIGKGESKDLHLKRGSVIFLKANEETTIKVKEYMILYQAFAGLRNIKGKQ